MAYYAVAPLLCSLLFFLSQGTALDEEFVQITLYPERVNTGNNVLAVGNGGFGSINMRDRPVFDGPGPGANVVGRLESVNFKSTTNTKSSWSIFLLLVFNDASRFSGSTLTLAGLDLTTDCDWSIVGGTGQLTMARGIVRRKYKDVAASMRNAELNIYAYYTPITLMGISDDNAMA